MSSYDAETKIWNGPKMPYPYSMDVTLGEIMLKNLSANPDKVLKIFVDDGTELTCDQLRIRSIRVAQHLQKIGIEEDDVVGLITHHSHFASSFINGCVFVGAIINPLDRLMTEEEIRHVYSESKPKIIVCDCETIPKLQSALKNADFSYRIYSTPTDATTSSYHLTAKNFLRPTGDEVNFKCPKFSKPSDEKILMILCSSGTTGKTKNVCTSHATAISAFYASSLFVNAPPTRTTLFSPIFWTAGFVSHLGLDILPNNTMILTARQFSVETFIEIVEKYRITSAFMAPFVFNTLLSSTKFLSSQNESLQRFTVAGAILSEEARKNFDELLPNRQLNISYGMTEQPATNTKPFEYRLDLSVGSMINPNISIKIVDEDGNALDNGQTGEICLKSTFKFLGYYRNLEATQQLMDEYGFIKSGDIGYFNDEGVLFVIDRKKEILKYKGIHVNPSETENVIESIEGVQAVSVVGIPDEFYGNLIAAAIVKRAGCEKLTEKEVVDFVASKLPEYKQLSGGVYFFDTLPTTLSGKILKRSILEEILKLHKKR